MSEGKYDPGTGRPCPCPIADPPEADARLDEPGSVSSGVKKCCGCPDEEDRLSSSSSTTTLSRPLLGAASPLTESAPGDVSAEDWAMGVSAAEPGMGARVGTARIEVDGPASPLVVAEAEADERARNGSILVASGGRRCRDISITAITSLGSRRSGSVG